MTTSASNGRRSLDSELAELEQLAFHAHEELEFAEWAEAPERIEISPGCFRKRKLPTADQQ